MGRETVIENSVEASEQTIPNAVQNGKNATPILVENEPNLLKEIVLELEQEAVLYESIRPKAIERVLAEENKQKTKQKTHLSVNVVLQVVDEVFAKKDNLPADSSFDDKIQLGNKYRDVLAAFFPEWQKDYVRTQEVARQLNELQKVFAIKQTYEQPSRWSQWVSPIQNFFSNVTYTVSRWFGFTQKTNEREQITLIEKKAHDFTQALTNNDQETINDFRKKIKSSGPKSSEELIKKFTNFTESALTEKWWPKNPRDDIKTAMGVSLEDCCLFLPKQINQTATVNGKEITTSVYPRVLLKTDADKKLAYEAPGLWQALSKVQRYKGMNEAMLFANAWDEDGNKDWYVLLPYSTLKKYAEIVKIDNQLSPGFKYFLTAQIQQARDFYDKDAIKQSSLVQKLQDQLKNNIAAGFDINFADAHKKECWDIMEILVRHDALLDAKDTIKTTKEGKDVSVYTQKTKILAKLRLNLLDEKGNFVAPDHAEWTRAANISALLSGEVPSAIQNFQKFFKGPRGQTSKIINHALTLANSTQLEELKKYETVLAKIEPPIMIDGVQQTPMALFSNDSVAIQFPKTGDLLARKLKELMTEFAQKDFKKWDELAFCVKTLWTWPGRYGAEPKKLANAFFAQLTTDVTNALEAAADADRSQLNSDIVAKFYLIKLITQKTAADQNAMPPQFNLAHEITTLFQNIRDNQDLEENETEATLKWINALARFVKVDEITDPDFKSYRILNSNTSSTEQILNRTTLLGLKRLSDVPNNTIKNKRGIFLEKIKQAILSSVDPLAELEKLYGEETDLTALKADPGSQTASDDKAIKVLIGDICKNANSSLKVSKFSEAFLEKVTENLRKAHPSAARITVDINTKKDDDFNNMVDRAGRQTATLEQCAVAALHSRLLNKKPGLWKLLKQTGCLPINKYCVNKPILTSNSIKVKSLPKKDDAADSAKKRLEFAAPNVTGIRSHKP